VAKPERMRCSLPSTCFPPLVLLFSFALRTTRLGRLNLWGDEAWALYLNHLGLLDMTIATGRDLHPPLYYYLAYLWTAAAGSSEFVLRYLSVFAGVLVVALMYAFGRRLADWRVGVLSAVLIAWAPFAVHYSQEARPYSWALLWSVLAAYSLWRALLAPSRLAWLGYALASFLAAFTLYSTALWFAAHGLVLLARYSLMTRHLPVAHHSTRGPWQRHLVTWLGIEAGVLLLALPWLLIFGRATEAHLVGQGQFTGREVLSIGALTTRTVSGLLAGVTLPQEIATPLASIVLAVGLAGVLLARPRRWEVAATLATLVLLPVLGLYPIHTLFTWYEPRVLAFCAVPLYVLLAVGLDGWCSRGLGWLALAGTVVALVWGGALADYFHFDRYSPDVEDYRPLIARVQADAAPGDVVLYNAPWHVGYFQAYYNGPHLDFRPLALASLDSLFDRQRQVWVVARDIVRHPGGTASEDQVEDALSARAFKVQEAWFGRIRLAHYVIPSPTMLLPHPVNVFFEHGLSLTEFTIQPELKDGVLYVEPGQAVFLTLAWEVDQIPDLAYHVFTHIVGPFNPASGNPVWAQHDGVPVNQEYPTTGWKVGEIVRDAHVMWVDPVAQPGDYMLEVGMYEPGTGERLSVIGPDGTQVDRVVLAHVQVAEP
jgi:4-amino-4-deoxy-L-arabinose transferase-like glycosyltransferase